MPVGLALLAAILLAAGLALRPSPVVVQKLQKDFEAGVNLVPAYCRAVWLPRGLLIDVLLCGVLGMLWGLGKRRLTSTQECQIEKTTPLLWTAVVGIMLLSGLLNSPRLTQGLWGDEVMTMRNAVVGRVKPDSKGAMRVMPTSWSDTAFDYWQPNNHVLYSLVARVTHTLWPKSHSKTAPYFSEMALRLPAYLAGLLAIPMLALVAFRLGLHKEGVTAVILLALHPWFVRYSTEARGYAFLLLLIPALIFCILQAARTGLWRWWLLMGLTQFLLLYTQPLSLHVILPAMLSAVLLVFTRWTSSNDRRTVFLRMMGGCLVGAMLALPLMLPLYPQLQLYLRREVARWSLDGVWLRDAGSQLGLGIYWQDLDPSNSHGVVLGNVAMNYPWLIPAGLALAALIMGWGVMALWRHSRVTRCLLPVLLLPVVELTAAHALGKKVLMPWYLIIGLPGLVIVFGTGIVALSRVVAQWTPQRRWAEAVVAALACLLFGLATSQQRLLLRTVPIDPRREAASVYMPTFNPRDPQIEGIVTGGIGPPVTVDLAYDPGALCIRNTDDLHALQETAIRTGRPFFLNCPRYDFAVRRSADVMHEVEHSGAYELLGKFYGVDKERAIRVYRFKPEAVPVHVSTP